LTLPFCRALALALLHFLWQGTLVAVLLAMGDFLFPNARARARYLAACVALATMLVLPSATLWHLADRSVNGDPRIETMQAEAPADSGASTKTDPVMASGRLALLTPWIVLFWLAGVLALSLRVLGGWFAAQRLKHRRTRGLTDQWEARLASLAKRLRVSQPVRLLESALVEVPTAIGVLRPVILLPAGILTGLAADQIDSLLAHELAHIRRRDCLVNLIQAFAETLLFYHPAVWWVSRRIRIERENACDDLAVAATGDAAVYARALVELEERRGFAPRLAMAASGGRLWRRITRLFPAAEAPVNRSPRWVAAALALGGMLAIGAAANVLSVDGESGARSPAGGPSAIAPVPRASNDSAEEPAAPPGRRAEKTGKDPAPQPTPSEVPAEPADGEDPAAAKVEGTSAGGGLLTPEQLIAFRIHGITPEFIRQLEALGYDKASPDDLLALRIHGATPDYISKMSAVSGKLPLAKYVAFRIHGVTPESAKDLEALFGKLSVDEILAMRIHGVHASFVKAFRDAGYGTLSADQAVSLRIHGVNPADSAAWKSLGLDTPSIDELLAMRIHGVTPELLRAMRELGFAHPSVDEMLAFRIHGVTPEFVKEIHALGYASISAEELVSFRIHGVTPEHIRAMNHRAGRRLTPDRLIESRIDGHDEETEE
jgi:beta-lactamase regulating signal transducer with metallopeptidase domain